MLGLHQRVGWMHRAAANLLPARHAFDPRTGSCAAMAFACFHKQFPEYVRAHTRCGAALTER